MGLYEDHAKLKQQNVLRLTGNVKSLDPHSKFKKKKTLNLTSIIVYTVKIQ